MKYFSFALILTLFGCATPSSPASSSSTTAGTTSTVKAVGKFGVIPGGPLPSNSRALTGTSLGNLTVNDFDVSNDPLFSLVNTGSAPIYGVELQISDVANGSGYNYLLDAWGNAITPVPSTNSDFSLQTGSIAILNTTGSSSIQAFNQVYINHGGTAGKLNQPHFIATNVVGAELQITGFSGTDSNGVTATSSSSTWTTGNEITLNAQVTTTINLANWSVYGGGTITSGVLTGGTLLASASTDPWGNGIGWSYNGLNTGGVLTYQILNTGNVPLRISYNSGATWTSIPVGQAAPFATQIENYIDTQGVVFNTVTVFPGLIFSTVGASGTVVQSGIYSP